MRALTFLASILITCISCNCQKKAAEPANLATQVQDEKSMADDQKNTMKIEYEANNRGFYQKIIVQNQMISVSKDRDSDKAVTTKISDTDWKQLVSFFNDVNLAQLPNLKSPTEKRFYDGAPIAGLKITSKDKTYQTTDFDHGFPPAEIKKLVDKLVSLTE